MGAEKRRAEELEQQKKKDHKIKIEQLSLSKPQNGHDKTETLERPKKNLTSNPLARKFEELALLALNEREFQRDVQMKKQKSKLKKQSVINKSKQILCKITKRIRGSQIIKGNSKELIAENDFSQNVEVDMEEERKKDMQNYLISQVLFNGKEDVKSMAITQETDIDASEIQSKSDNFELKKEQAFFEAYKQNMEEYLDFVCGDKQKKSVVKKEKSKSKKVNRKS